MRRLSVPLWFSAAVTYLFLYAPIAVVTVYSFNARRYGMVWSGFTTRWYRELFQSSEKILAAENTVVLALASTLVSTLLGTLLGYGLARYRFAGQRIFSWLMYIPVVIPDIVMAVAMLLFFALLRRWTGLFELGLPTMILAHITFQIPFVAIVVRSRLSGMDPSIEEAARDLGADGWQTFRHVTLPLIAPGIVAGALLAFTLSLDDFVVSFFTAGPGSTTLPILIYSSVKRGITPDINALSTLIVLASVAGTLLMSLPPRLRVRSFQVVLVLVGAAFLFGRAAAPKNRLNLLMWSEYIDPQVIRDFEKRYDCKVTLDVFEDLESMMAKLQQGGSSLYDVITPTNYVVPALLRLKLVQEIRHENVPNLANIEPRFASPFFDPGNRYTAPYQWGTNGIYLRKKPGQTLERTWGLFFDPAKQPGSFMLIDGIRETIGAALKFRGHSLNSTSPRELLEARDTLLETKRRCAGFEGGVGGKNRVLSRGVVAAMAYNGDAVRGMREDPETEYFVPEEGSEIWMDNMAIPAQAPNRTMAEKFINFVLEPETGARISNFTQYATPNRAALPFIEPKDRANPAIYPPPAIMEKLEFLRDIGPALKLYDEVWTQVKSK
ncbi:MAG TPA: extracellular solute-binding protein [Thermoanaerobaculia bacterium]|nr:extracellular solute-binding protein [Thermoanaerobaculia bacterium]